MLNLIKSEVNYIEGLKLVDKIADSMPAIDEDADDDQGILGHCELLKNVNNLILMLKYEF